ncbi:DNA-3-methyladenine glycosylase 2 family protein [Bacillaceae bacterium S4-13-58]
MEKYYYTYNHPHALHLSEVDPILKKLIEKVEVIDVPLRKDYYNSIVKQIIGQQLSLKAAHTITNRVLQLWGNFDPILLEQIDNDQLRNTGVSRPKISYIRDLTNKHINGEVDLKTIHLLKDEDVIERLTSVKGIGKWTAEMFLIFSLGRMNILSFGDVSIQNAIRWLYKLEKDQPLDLQPFYEKWSPYNTVASLYLWQAINSGIVKNEID